MRHIDTSKVLAAALSYTQQEIANVEVRVVEMLENFREEQDMLSETRTPGPVGDRGEQGDTGDQGTQGEQGERGYMGPIGIEGPRGVQGQEGERGDPFQYQDFTEEQLEHIQGDRGERGWKGEQGNRGLRGDAFEYENFTTEQLDNLIGADGKQGEQGVDGIPGLRGDPGLRGEHGISGKIGETGEKGDRGSRGYKGEQGRPGKSGKDGDSFLYENFTKEQLEALKPQVDDVTNQINEEVQKYRNDMMRTISNITSTHAGGGEVQFKYLDDVDVSNRSATKKFPQYDTATDKIVFDDIDLEGVEVDNIDGGTF
jgi:hypothetical protein